MITKINKIDLTKVKLWEEQKFLYNFYMTPTAMKLLKELKEVKGLQISNTINNAIIDYYKSVMK
jgi:hypothetical protein